uniref:A-kinase anchoring protein 13 n=1 Tax=Anas platyrhynchos TaxID=8839 RepID=A0A8B9R4Z9_ANAPL
ELITVQLTEEDKVEDDVVFYLVFTGSTVQHCTSTRKINPGSLETISPGHDCCETVKVVLCASKEGHPILVVAEESFQFIQDEAYDAAQFLATCAGNQQALIFTRFLDRSRPPAADVDFLDEKVALAFRHLKLPAEWNVLGADQSLNENIPRETLMHFAVRLGLLRLTWFLLQQPGGRGALSIHNNEGATPVSLALERGYQKLHQLLTEEEAREPDSWSTLSHTVHAGEYCVKHHRRLDVYLLTAETKEGTKASLESDIRQLQLHMQSGHPTTSSQSLEEMAGEGREENPSDVIHLNSGQLSDQAHQEDKSPNGSLGAVSDGPNGLLSLGDAESPACSCESKNTVTLGEKEEEGPGSAEGSGAVSDENGCTASPHAGVNGAVNLPSCGNTDEEAGMTSAGVVLDQAGLCSKDSTHQEAPAAEERAAESAVPGLQTAGEAPASPTGTDVAMGQTECRNCTGAADRAPGHQQVEDRMAETVKRRTVNPEERLAAEEEPASAAQPLLDGFNGSDCTGEEDANVGVVAACASTNTGIGTGGVSVDLCKSGDNKETGAGSRTDQVTTGLLESQGDARVEERQDGTASTATTLPAVNGTKAPACSPEPGLVLESQGSATSGEQEGQVEVDSMDGKSSSPSLEDSLETDGPENGDGAGANQGSAEPVHGQGSSEVAESAGEAREGGEAQKEESVGTDTSSSGDGGSVDSANGAQEVASCCPSVDQTAVKDAMGDSSKLDAAQVGEQEPGSLPLEDARACLVEQEPPQDGEEAAESPPGQEGMSSEVKSLSPHLDAEHPTGDAAAALPGQEAALRGNDPGLSPCAKGADCAEDNFVGTPSVIHNEESKQKQEVAAAAAAGSAELAPPCSKEHGEVTGVLGEHAGVPGPPKHGLQPQAEGGTAKPEQEASDSSREQVLSEELLATVVKSSACSPGGPVDDVDAGAGLKEPVPKELVGEDALEVEAPSVAFEAEEALQIAAITPVTGYEEEQQDLESVLPRAALQPIAEEPTCDSDSSTDTVCPGSEGDAAPAATATQGEVSAQPEGKQSRAVSESALSPCSSGLNAVESPEHVGVKSLVSADDGSSPDKVPKMVKSFDAVVFAAGTPSSPDLPAEANSIYKAAFCFKSLNLLSVCRLDILILQNTSDCNSFCFASLECENFLEDGLSSVCASSQGVLKRESGSESDLFPLPGDGMEDLVFGKQPEEEQSACDVTSSSSSADDTISLERNSSLGSDTSLPFPPAVSFMQPKDRRSLDGSCTSMAAPEGGEGEPAGLGEKDEELDSITDVPTPSSVLRNSMRPLSPFRRHSWGPGKNATNEAEINQRSSMRVLGDGIKKPPIHRRSYSLEGLAGDAGESKKPSANLEAASLSSKDLRRSPLASNQCGSLVLLTEELEQGEIRDYDRQMHPTSQPQGFNFCTSSVSSPLTKSVSLMSISKPALDSEIDLCKVTRHSFIFSWQEKEKDKEKTKEKDKDSKEKEKDKKLLNGHLFTATSVVAQATCYHCMKPFNKDSYYCANCNAIVHKGCKESFASCAKVKMKPQKGMLQAHDTSSLPTVTMRNKSSQPKERPRSAILAPDENTVTSIFNNRRSQQTTALSKSVSIQNIAGVGNDDSLIHTWKFLSQSTDSLHKISRVNESMESLVDEGADMNEGQLMGDLELDSKLLEAESWSQVVDSKFLQQQNKDVVKRQDVIYELMQTEMHHVRTLKIMNDVYSAGMLKELQYDQQIVDKIFPCLENLLHIHSHFFQRILERKKESLADKSEKNFVIKRIGDILVNQFSGENAERMKKTYGKFCGHHNEAVNNFKDLYSKDKRFQAFVKKKMSSSLVRRLGISECILLVTQRITKYPVLLQRILQYTKENEVEHEDLTQSLNLVKDVIAAVNSKVSNYEKKTRLDEIYNRTDSKSIMRMKSGQMFAREDLRHRKLIRDGPVSLKNAAGRLKEVQAVLLSDMLIFLQEKDQKYVFASLDQKSTVISLKKLIVREVAHEEKGLFLISMGVKDPEMVEVHASSKEERNGWKEIIQDTIYTMDKDEDEGVPCESEFEKKVSDTRVRALKEQLHQKDKQILVLLEEKTKIFRDMADTSAQEDMPGSRLLFRANTEEAPKGEAIMKTAINEVELLQDLVNRSLGCALGQQVSTTIDQEGVGPISLPRRAETFGGFDSHQMNASKCGVKDEGDDAQDLRRTESDSILKKVSLDLSGVVLQQDTYIEDQKLALSERALTRSFFRPTSLLEQEKQRNLEKQRQEFANLKKQQAQHQEEKRRKEKEWEARENQLTEQEAQLAQREEQVQRGWQDLEREREELQVKKAAYQLDLERLRTAQKQLERDKAQLKRDMERLPQTWLETDHNQVSNTHEKLARVSSQSSIEDFSKQKSPSLPKQGHFDAELSVSPKRNSLSRTHKEKSTFHLLSTTNQTNKAAEEQPQMPTRLFSLSKPKEKKDKKKKGRGHRSQQSDSHSSEAPPEGEEIFC